MEITIASISRVSATLQRLRSAATPNMKTPASRAPLLPSQSGAFRPLSPAWPAVVVTVRVAVPLFVPPPSVIGLPLTEHAICAVVGAVQVKLTEPLNPLRASTVIVDVPDCPAAAMLTTFPKIV
jgi:hypothetical protein